MFHDTMKVSYPPGFSACIYFWRFVLREKLDLTPYTLQVRRLTPTLPLALWFNSPLVPFRKRPIDRLGLMKLSLQFYG